MKGTTRSSIKTAIAIIMAMVLGAMVLGAICAPAHAYDNSVHIYVNGTKVDGVEAFLDGDGKVWVSDSLKAARKLFPKETADLYFPAVIEDKELQDMANAFGYTMKLDGKTAYLTNGGSNNNDKNDNDNNGDNSNNDNDGDDSNNGNVNDNETAVTIYINGKKVNVDAYTTGGDNTVWLRNGFTALLKLFPTEAGKENFTGQDVSMRLKPYADKYGYSYEKDGNKVYLEKEEKQETRKTATIYVNGDKITKVEAWIDEDGVVWLENGYSAIQRIFPNETASEKFPTTVIDIKLKMYATEYGYKMNVEGTEVYLTKQSDGNNTSTLTIMTNGVKVTGTKAYIDDNGTVWLKDGYKDLIKILPEETINVPANATANELKLKTWAEKYGYTFEQKNNEVTLTKEAMKEQDGVKVYLNGMRVRNVNFVNWDNQEVRFDFNDIFKIFPEATTWKTTLISGNNYTKKLQDWAQYYKYSYVQNGLRVYMNNDGIKPMEVHVNGRIVDFPDVQPFVQSGRTMVPIRSVAEMLGCNVEWLNKTVRITSGDTTIVLYINSKVYTINGVEHSMNVAPYVQSGRTLVPIRFIAEAFGFNVQWDNRGRVNVATLTK